MKPDIHPKTYRKVVFKDMSCDYCFITQSCVDTKETIKWAQETDLSRGPVPVTDALLKVQCHEIFELWFFA